ncbi:hypothetical protein L1987_80271 [Smallanthus sonchifolius]|uniref:Uncharacterized protein n=1 Tax=Smallanthus sonchifolius TaxID=185202 RepID=A0ACB8YNA7_9ASTR|nr:hypothetical protein L1987_80271 [Smallanthus sonchifolius]
MSGKRKRGASTCKKKRSSSDQSGINFNANGVAIGEKASDFMSWVGAEFKNRVPINKVAKDVDSKLYDRIWEYAKETWKISDDHTKHTTLRKGKDSKQRRSRVGPESQRLRRAQFGATSDKQTMPNETDAYRQYSYALRDDEGFYELFYQHTELVIVYDQHTESIHVSQNTKTVPSTKSEKENEKIAKEKKR